MNQTKKHRKYFGWATYLFGQHSPYLFEEEGQFEVDHMEKSKKRRTKMSKIESIVNLQIIITFGQNFTKSDKN